MILPKIWEASRKRRQSGHCARPAMPQPTQDILRGPVGGWTGLSFLDLTVQRQGHGMWEDWFEAASRPGASPRYLGVNSYSYVLEAAISRWGVALGSRGFIERCLDNGSLVALADRFVETGNTYYCVLAEKRRDEQIPSRTSAWSSSNTRRDNVVGRCRSGAHFALQYAFSKSEISPSLASLCAMFFASLGVFPNRPVQPLYSGS